MVMVMVLDFKATFERSYKGKMCVAIILVNINTGKELFYNGIVGDCSETSFIIHDLHLNRDVCLPLLHTILHVKEFG